MAERSDDIPIYKYILLSVNYDVSTVEYESRVNSEAHMYIEHFFEDLTIQSKDDGQLIFICKRYLP